MARLPLTLADPAYHTNFEAFAHDVAAELADALLDEKVSKEAAHSCVETFLFRFAMMFDAGGSYKTNARLKPQVAFSNGLGQLTVPTEDTYLHERVHEIVEAVFNVEGRR